MTMNGRRRYGLLGALTALALVATSCGGDSDALEYKDGQRALFELPPEWHLYEADELTTIQARPFVTNFGSQLAVITEVGFDGAPGRAVANLNAPVATLSYPVGSYTVRSVGEAEKDAISRALLEQTVLWPDAFSISEQPLVKEDFSFSEDYEGIRRFLAFRDEAADAEGLVYFITVTDAADTKIFSMAAGCSRACWETYGEQIVDVVDSWLVNTRR